MTFPRKKVKWSPSNELTFLCIDWIECDETIYEDFTSDDYFNKDGDEGITEEDKKHNKYYTIFVFGTTIEGYSVCAKIINYKPYFYVKIPDIFKKKQKLKKKFIREFFDKKELNFSKINTYNKIDEKISSSNSKISNDASYLLKMRDKLSTTEHKSALDNKIICEKNSEIFWSFTNNAKYDFWKLPFQSKEGYHLFSSFMKMNKHFPKIIDKNSEEKKPYYLDFKLFESELEPLLRFFHDMKIKPSNWIKFDKRSYKMKPNMSSCQINVEIDYRKIIPIDKQEIPPLIVASYDIECDSSHGDFPLAKKDYKKLANELVVSYLNKKIKLNKMSKASQEYKLLSSELKTHLFFKNRIIQAFDLNKEYYLSQKKDNETDEERTKLMEKLKPKIDDEISKVYFKVRDIKSKKDNKITIENYLKTENFNKLCKELLFICDRPIKKIIANQKMKAAIASINIQYERKEEYRIKTYKQDAKPCSIHDLIAIIKTVSKKTKFSLEDLKTKILGKDVLVKYVNQELRCSFPQVKGDKVIQIGTVFWRYGDDKPIYNNMITLKECAPIPNVDIYSFTKEKDLLLEWTKMIRNYDPDIILGYNIFGFDEVFMFDRANELIAKGNTNDTKYQKFINMGRLNAETYKNIWNCKGKLLKKKLASSALGANYLEYFNTPGRVQIDLLKVIQGGLTKLDSYKLDSVAEFYICGKILNVGRSECDDVINESQWLHITNIKELEVGNYVIITLKTGEKVENGTKFIIEELDVENEYIKLTEPIPTSINSQAPKWGIAKDDVTPKQIFEFQKGTNEQRAIVAKYCIQDCALVIRLLKKLDTIVNNFGMSNVCIVPFSYIFMRGQGIKIFSLVVNECSESGFLLPTLDKVWTDKEDDTTEIDDEAIEVGETSLQTETLSQLVSRDDEDEDRGDAKFTLGDDFNKININGDGYEGAIVLEPIPGIYIDDPITVLDFSSLYPSEMIASNLSHDSHCEDEFWLGDEGGKRIKALGYDYLDVEYDVFSWIDPKNHNKGKQKTGVTTERFVQYNDGKKGLIPNIEKKLLGARKATKKKMKEEKDPFKQSILDGLQLAYKVTANSLYGQIGASTSKIYKKAIAASTTAGGRRCIYRAKDYCLKNNPGCEVVYGDTDSVFVKFNLVYEDGTYPQTDLDKVQRSMDIGLKLQQKLKDDNYYTPPHDLEYEKVFYPLMLITKKRYAGEKFEFNAKSSAFTSMGIVLKRRDNAPILKHAYGGVMKKIMKEKNIESAIEFVRQCCQEIIDNKYELNMFVISKTLRDYYKDPESIAHKVLADRMGERDPGNKPASNERIPYAYIKVEEKEGVKLLQGDKIEHVNYITENNLQLDYYIYIKNQLLKPICQIFELVVENMKGYPYHANHFENLWHIYYEKYKGDKKKTDKKISEEKQKVVAKLIFKEYMIKAHNKQNKVNTLDGWLQIIDDAFKDNDDNDNEDTQEVVDNSKKTSTTKQVKKTVIKKKLKRQTAISDFF